MGWDVRVGDCRQVMASMEAASVHAVVCDPPYGLRFMGKEWDHGIPGEAFWREALRVAKPGAHLVAFGGTRTFHRLACAIEDAGWEIRDCLSWLYGEGFPKSLDVSKAIDKADGHWRVRASGLESGNGSMSGPNYGRTDKGDPICADAQAWDGWGAALKPAWEPIILARKPLIGTVAQNVLAHGCGALNVDGCRIDASGRPNVEKTGATWAGSNMDCAESRQIGTTDVGRWPANVVLDAEAGALLDAQSGERGGSFAYEPENGTARSQSVANVPGINLGRVEGFGDTGGASRFFFTVKEDPCGPASIADESSSQPSGPGVSAPEAVTSSEFLARGIESDRIRFRYEPKADRAEREIGMEWAELRRDSDRSKVDGPGGDNPRNRTNAPARNHHPTVKPIALMQWLVRLVARPGSLVLDPFMGSGSTGIAALRESCDFVGIELSEEYAEIARRRIVGDAPLLNQAPEPEAAAPPPAQLEQTDLLAQEGA